MPPSIQAKRRAADIKTEIVARLRRLDEMRAAHAKAEHEITRSQWEKHIAAAEEEVARLEREHDENRAEEEARKPRRASPDAARVAKLAPLVDRAEAIGTTLATAARAMTEAATAWNALAAELAQHAHGTTREDCRRAMAAAFRDAMHRAIFAAAPELTIAPTWRENTLPPAEALTAEARGWAEAISAKKAAA